jgi:hypothetical protein
LIALVFNAHDLQWVAPDPRAKTNALTKKNEIPVCFTNFAGVSAARLRGLTARLLDIFVFRRPGGICGEPVPDPIPNSAVNLPCADGTKSQDLGE